VAGALAGILERGPRADRGRLTGPGARYPRREPAGSSTAFTVLPSSVSATAWLMARGAKAAAGGGPIDRPGYFFAPTILTGVAEGARIVDEEQFGPALPVMAYRTVAEAVERANGTPFGLSGSVWGTDTEQAARVAAQLDSGVVFVNDHLTLEPHLPFGGVKWSGAGVENGPWGLEEFSSLRVLYQSRR
jgi:acyl-CoA reductase-like NAD-dependent aldehyde dehydrogenase